MKAEICGEVDAKLLNFQRMVEQQNWQLGTNTVENLHALTPQNNALQGGLATMNRIIQLQEERTDIIFKTVQNLNAKLVELEGKRKDNLQGEL